MESNKKIELIRVFNTIKEQNPNMSLDELLYAVYNEVKKSEDEMFETLRPLILEANGINEYEYYTKDVDEELKKYIQENIFPKYDLNDKGHGIIHILEVIRTGLIALERGEHTIHEQLGKDREFYGKNLL